MTRARGRRSRAFVPAPTIQEMVKLGHVAPSAESERPETRIFYVAPWPCDTHYGACAWCGDETELNRHEECWGCWSNRGLSHAEWRRRMDDIRAGGISRAGMLAGAVAETGAAWDLRAHARPTADGPTYHFPPVYRVPRAWRHGRYIVRARFPWQVDCDFATLIRTRWDGPGRDGRPRTAHVPLRCLVCLAVPEGPNKLLLHQACENCRKAWKRAGSPWGPAFDDLMTRRRARVAAAAAGEERYVAALSSAVFRAGVRPPLAGGTGVIPGQAPGSRPNAKRVVRGWDHGLGGGVASEPLRHSAASAPFLLA